MGPWAGGGDRGANRVGSGSGNFAVVTRRLLPLLLGTVLLAGACVAGTDGDGDRGSSALSGGGLRAGGLQTAGDVPTEPITEQRFVDFNNEPGTFARFGGKPLVVNFWSSTCVPCITEMPDFEAVHREMGDKVGFVGVNVVDIPSEATRMARQIGVTYPLVRDPDGALLSFVGGVSMPTTAFVTADGQVVKVISRTLSAQDLRESIAALQ